ncbi:hypothetical protein AVEN_37000-1 [Araneus ventricosus]|uniref:Uncharacterized protein n=1 Tax=Araneus ventricosus TaxID=182803 RepID=A0A4Y2KT39_ARAVE|nr:hypothetical protein AVEN_37000-1 [Araneus ventricosus]
MIARSPSGLVMKYRLRYPILTNIHMVCGLILAKSTDKSEPSSSRSGSGRRSLKFGILERNKRIGLRIELEIVNSDSRLDSRDRRRLRSQISARDSAPVTGVLRPRGIEANLWLDSSFGELRTHPSIPWENF